jgi:hypothetical protein
VEENRTKIKFEMDLKTDIVENMTTDNCSEEHSQEIDMEMVDNESGDNTTETGSF